METNKRSNWADCGGTNRDRRNQRRVTLWMLGWIAPWLLLTLGIKKEWFAFGPLAIIALIVITLIGGKGLLTYRRYLLEADELRRKIELEALAITVGVSLLVGFTYATLEEAGVIGQTDVLTLVMVMMFTYMVSVIAGMWRYGFR